MTRFPRILSVRFGFILLLIGALPAWTLGESLSNLIAGLEVTRRSKADLAQLIYWQQFDGQYAKASQTARSLYILDPGWGPLFDELLSRLAAKDPLVAITVRDLYGLPEKEKPGPRWMARIDMLRDISLSGKINDEDRYLAWVQELWYAKGWSLTKVAIDIYEKYGGKKDLAFLWEIRVEAYFKAGFPDEAIAWWKALYRKTGDEYYLYQQARIYFRREQFAETWGLLKTMRDENLMSFHYYFMLCKSCRALNFREDMNASLSMARSKIGSDRESQLFQTLVN
ncbi:MAG: hypothetical protein J0L75_20710 [Spirochaetes bacterium]|nr:hypothetical protein [Spirochaetota bacterium]